MAELKKILDFNMKPPFESSVEFTDVVEIDEEGFYIYKMYLRPNDVTKLLNSHKSNE